MLEFVLKSIKKLTNAIAVAIFLDQKNVMRIISHTQARYLFTNLRVYFIIISTIVKGDFMYKFNPDFYADVRIEDRFSSTVVFKNGALDALNERVEKEPSYACSTAICGFMLRRRTSTPCKTNSTLFTHKPPRTKTLRTTLSSNAIRSMSQTK